MHRRAPLDSSACRSENSPRRTPSPTGRSPPAPSAGPSIPTIPPPPLPSPRVRARSASTRRRRREEPRGCSPRPRGSGTTRSPSAAAGCGRGGVAGLAVHPAHRGDGLFAESLAGVLARCDEESLPVSMLYPSNPEIYRRHGYQVIARVETLEVPLVDLQRLRSVPGRRTVPVTAASMPRVRALYEELTAGDNAIFASTGAPVPGRAPRSGLGGRRARRRGRPGSRLRLLDPAQGRGSRSRGARGAGAGPGGPPRPARA
ncbi:GNAT family N-acetyltransferase [Brachybacterium sp. GPGPB12]|uniref:GNAT family N-acetyltransferase n=1 Tax=Brachybacterium sp. GPGPB12 TaxID=3023517 RepID=UPI00313463DD